MEYNCVFNNGVECTECCSKCRNCGWNPEVAEKRSKELRNKMERK